MAYLLNNKCNKNTGIGRLFLKLWLWVGRYSVLQYRVLLTLTLTLRVNKLIAV